MEKYLKEKNMKIVYSQVMHFTPLNIERLVDIYTVRRIISFWIGLFVVGLIVFEVLKFL